MVLKSLEIILLYASPFYNLEITSIRFLDNNDTQGHGMVKLAKVLDGPSNLPSLLTSVPK